MAIAEEYLGSQFLGIRQTLETGELDDVHWLPGPDNPADGPAKVKSDMAPPLHLPLSGSFCPGTIGPLRGVAFTEGRGR